MHSGDVRRLIASARSPWGSDGSALRALSGMCESGDRLRRLVGVEVDNCVSEAVSAAWERGWQPADLARFVERTLSGEHHRYCIDAIGRDGDRYSPAVVDPRWRSQLEELGARCWWEPGAPHLWQWAAREGLLPGAALGRALAVFAVVTDLPALPRLCDPPGQWCPRRPEPEPEAEPDRHRRSRPRDPRMLEKVRALLAKAESTTFPAEAEALTAKAQELISRYSIDAAMVWATSRVLAAPGPRGIRIAVDNPYASAKSALLGAVARANNCKALWSKHFGFSTVIGFECDLDAVEVLYTSLLVQASSAMVAAGPQADWRGRSRTRSFRQSFLVAYAVRIGERLRSTAESAAESATEHFGEALLPVLARRAEQVEERVTELFPRLGRTRFSVTNAEGYRAGRAAADLAWLSPRREVPA